MGEKQQPRRRGPLEVMAALAARFMVVSPRSGGMMTMGDLIPVPKGLSYTGRHTAAGRRKHAAEVRATKRRQRRRAYYRGMR